MPAQVATVGRIEAVGAHHHGHGIPAHVGAQALFDGDVAGATGLLIGLDGVHVAGVGRERQVNAVLPRMLQQLLQQKMGALGAFLVDDGGQRLHPFARFLRVDVIGCRGPSGGVFLGGHACLLGCGGGNLVGSLHFCTVFQFFK